MIDDARNALKKLWYACALVLGGLIGLDFSGLFSEINALLGPAPESDLVRRAIKIVSHIVVFGVLFLPVWLLFGKPWLTQVKDHMGDEEASRVLHPLFLSALLHALPIVLLLTLSQSAQSERWMIVFVVPMLGYCVWLRTRGRHEVEKAFVKARLPRQQTTHEAAD